MNKNLRLSQQQLNYAAAKAIYEVANQASREYDKLIDAECERLGLGGPYGILPEGHPMCERAQSLLDAENAARALMYQAAYDLFDWATTETFKRCGTPAQQQEILAAVAKVKKMAFVEKHFQELVDMSMRLAA